MRLWHQALIHYLDNKRLLSQHRECCALRGKGWGKKHSVVDYVFKYDLAHLYEYHRIVMSEMKIRGYNANSAWYNCFYRGKHLPKTTWTEFGTFMRYAGCIDPIYKEHDCAYLKECLLNLKAKNAQLINGRSIDEMLIDCDLRCGVLSNG